MYHRLTSGTAEETFGQLFSRVSRLFDPIGMDALNPEFCVSRRMIVTWSTLLFAAAEIVFFMWRQRSDVVELMVLVPYATISVQALHMMILAWVKQSSYRALHSKSREIFEMLYECSSNWPVMCKPLRIGKFLQDLLAIMYTVFMSFAMVIPLVIWGFTGQKLFALFYRIPGVDECSTEGFLVTLAFHTVMFLIAYCGFLGIDSLFLAWIFPIVAFADAMGNEIDELNKLLEREELQKIQSKFNRVLQLHQLLIQYELWLEELYNLVILVKLGSIVFGLIGSILVIFETQAAMAFLFLDVLLVQLTQYCLLGAVVGIKNDQLTDTLYEINWYLLPIQQAKQLTLVLARAQNAPTLTVGKFIALDMECYDKIINRIYSLVTFIATFLE